MARWCDSKWRYPSWKPVVLRVIPLKLWFSGHTNSRRNCGDVPRFQTKPNLILPTEPLLGWGRTLKKDLWAENAMWNCPPHSPDLNPPRFLSVAFPQRQCIPTEFTNHRETEICHHSRNKSHPERGVCKSDWQLCQTSTGLLVTKWCTFWTHLSTAINWLELKEIAESILSGLP